MKKAQKEAHRVAGYRQGVQDALAAARQAFCQYLMTTQEGGRICCMSHDEDWFMKRLKAGLP